MKKPLLLIFLVGSIVSAQAATSAVKPCPAHIDLVLTRQAHETIFHLRDKTYAKYPLGAVGKVGGSCPEITMYIIADSGVPLDDVLTAYEGGIGKNQISQVLIFVRDNGFFLPIAVGEQSTKDPRK